MGICSSKDPSKLKKSQSKGSPKALAGGKNRGAGSAPDDATPPTCFLWYDDDGRMYTKWTGETDFEGAIAKATFSPEPHHLEMLRTRQDMELKGANANDTASYRKAITSWLIMVLPYNATVKILEGAEVVVGVHFSGNGVIGDRVAKAVEGGAGVFFGGSDCCAIGDADCTAFDVRNLDQAGFVTAAKDAGCLIMTLDPSGRTLPRYAE